MFRRFGAEVTVVERGPRLASREDDDVCAAIKDILEREGITIHLGASDIRVAKDGDGVAVSTGSAVVPGSHLLVAVGRVPNTDDLGLEKAGVATDSRGYITVDDQLRTTVDHIWAMGDCNGKGRSLIRRTTTSRSWRPTCSTTNRGGSVTGSPPMRCTSIRRSGGPG